MYETYNELLKIFLINLEIQNIDQQRKSRTEGDIETYDEVVSRSGTRNDGFHNEPFPSSANDKNKKSFSGIFKKYYG